jgi:hypothetical protein
MCISPQHNNITFENINQIQLAELQITFDYRFIWINDIANIYPELDYWHVLAHNDNSEFMTYFTFTDWNIIQIPEDCIHLYNDEDCENMTELSYFYRIVQQKCERHDDQFEDYFDKESLMLTVSKQN